MTAPAAGGRISDARPWMGQPRRLRPALLVLLALAWATCAAAAVSRSGAVSGVVWVGSILHTRWDDAGHAYHTYIRTPTPLQPNPCPTPPHTYRPPASTRRQPQQQQPATRLGPRPVTAKTGGHRCCLSGTSGRPAAAAPRRAAAAAGAARGRAQEQGHRRDDVRGVPLLLIKQPMRQPHHHSIQSNYTIHHSFGFVKRVLASLLPTLGGAPKSFTEAFEAEFGKRHPAFVEAPTLAQALNAARAASKFLVVYLPSASPRDEKRHKAFCRTLTDPEVRLAMWVCCVCFVC